jgi:ribosome assembly protein 1
MPNPIEAQQARIHTLLAERFQSSPLLPSLPTTITTNVEKRMRLVSSTIQTCNSHVDDDVVVFVSKMAPVRVAELSPRDKAMYIAKYEDKHGESPIFDNNSEVFVAVARVFSGVLKRDSNLFVLGHRHDPLTTQIGVDYDLNGEIPSNFTAVTKIPIDTFGLYLCLGPSIFPCDETPAGNIVGIFGLDDQILKTATISSSWACPPMKAITFQAKPMVCVAVEPLVHQDLPLLEIGLGQLYQFDPVVEIGVDESGQHTMTCLGELHLEQCLKILSEKFAK